MNAYLSWNDALAARFFNSDMQGRIVYLDVNHNVLSDIKRSLPPEAGEFIAAVKQGPPWVYRMGVCQRALQSHQSWRRRRLEFPPYVAYLALFVLAAGTDGDYSHNAYYPRLRDLLDEPGRGTLPSFDRMWRLWDDLENWSILDKKGELGVFQSRTAGGYRHVGYPISQCILAEQDRIALPHVFYSAGLDPATFHPPDEIARSLRDTATRHLLLPRTVRIAENPGSELYSPLIETVTEELADWDGTVVESGSSPGNAIHMYGGLRLCMEVDRVAGIARAHIRCKLNHEFPEAGLALQGGFHADEDVSGWSMPITHSMTRKPVDASRYDWHSSLTMRTTSRDYLLRLPGQQVRIFASGEQEGITGLVETHVMPRGRPFYLCYPTYLWPQLEPWASTQCAEFTDLEIFQGLPGSWRLASIQEAVDDQAIRDNVRLLSFPSELRLRIVGGIRSRAGYNFFDFAPPSVEVFGGSPDVEIYCNDESLPPAAVGNVFPLPDDTPTGARITLEARVGQSVLKSRSLFLTGDFSLPQGEPLFKLDADGTINETSNDKPFVAGAYVTGYSHGKAASTATIFRDLEHEVGGVRGFLLGQNPGEIVEWPSGPFPDVWTPSWIINKRGRKKREAVYVGDILGVSSPSTRTRATVRQVRDWKKAIWYRRKQIIVPELPAERALWKKIQQVAGNV